MKKTNILIVSILFIAGLISIISAQNQGYSGCGVGNMMYGSYGQGFMFIGWITYILFIGLIIASIYWLFKSANSKRR